MIAPVTASRLASQSFPSKKIRPLRIGITIGLHHADESLWTNGIKQNAIFLAKLLATSSTRHEVLLLNTTNVEVNNAPLAKNLPVPIVPIDSGWQKLDVMIELGGQISADMTRQLKEQGTKIVSYCCGSEYVMNMEAMIFRRKLWDNIFVNPDYDQIWVIPQVAETSLHFFQTIRRKPAHIVPFVWDPMGIEGAVSDRADKGIYSPKDRPRLLTVIEPNINVLKFCLYPILIAEQAFREMPDKIGFLHVANSDGMVHDEAEFAKLVRHFDIVNANKASFIGRVDTPHFLADATDIMISHQWGSALNYIYLECCWQGYPLIHNAHLVSDLGYYYPENDAAEGARQLLTAIARHDEEWEAYRARQRQNIGCFLATNTDLMAEYDQLLMGLFE